MSEQQDRDTLQSQVTELEQRLREREEVLRQQSARLEATGSELERRIREAERARESAERYAGRMRFLSEAGKTLVGSLDYETTLRNVAELAVPAVADWCVVDLLDTNGELRRLAVAHADEERTRLLRTLAEQHGDAAWPWAVREVVRTNVPRLLSELPAELIASADAGQRSRIESLQLGSCVTVPLRARDRTLGALTLVCTAGAEPYGPEDLVLAQELAARAALAIDNARLVTDLDQAQQHLESNAGEMQAQTEELQAAVEELEATTQQLLSANDALAAARDAAEKARAVAEEANAAKSQFLATMSHELRTPLNAIDGYAELLELGIHGPVTPPQREALGRLRRAQKRLLTLINDVLNFARLEAGQVVLDLRDVLIADVMADVEAMVAPQVHERGQTLTIETDPALCVRGDPDRIEQILLNLAGNAVKFTAQGGSIRITAAREGALALIRVSDTGAGIPADMLEAIFEPFVQGQSGMIRDHGGVGLGLSISRDLARRMNGELQVDSRSGAGSTFTLVLPLADTHAAFASGESDHGSPRGGRASSGAG